MSKALDAAQKAIDAAQHALNAARGKPRATDIYIVLDRSGSMQTIAADTIGGFNRFLKEQKAVDAPATISLYQFDDVYEPVYTHKDIKDAPELSHETFVPRGWTALLDAIGRTISTAATRKTVGANTLVVVITDGHENQSREYNLLQIKSMIKEKEALGWQFVYLGANQDAFAVGSAMGFAGVNTMSVAANAVGTQSMYGSLSNTTTLYRSGASATMSFSDEDRAQQVKAGAVPPADSVPPAP